VRKITWTFILGVLSLAVATASFAQTSYTQANLVGDQAGVGAHTDAQLSNPWGISFIPGDVFWIANNNGGTSTTYDAAGNKQAITTGIPVAAHNPCAVGCPTGTVANTVATDFGGATFIFDTEDGIIASWNGTLNAKTQVDNSANGAVYKGLALVNSAGGNFLLAANFNSGAIDVFDSRFSAATLSGGSFRDPALPAGYAPHGVHVINNLVFVAYAQQDAAKHDPVLGAGLGLVDVFHTDGSFLRRGMTGGTLNAPWGVVMASANFGTFSNDLLVGNFGDGTINAYDTAGTFKGQMKNENNQLIAIPGLWDMVYGAGGTGDPNTLYITAGGSSQTHGLFATLVPTPAAGKDFALQLSATSATVTRGGSTTVNIGSTASGGFTGPVNLSCTGLPAGVTCAFNPATIDPSVAGASSQLTIAVGTTYIPPNPYVAGAFLMLGAVGMFWGTRRRAEGTRSKKTWALGGLVLLVALMMAAVGCGSYSSKGRTGGGTTLMVVGTSGGVSHADPLALTIQ
jgi:uncharacterized protein (TIGR03118 family)